MSIAYHDHLQIFRNRLPINVLEALLENRCAPMRWDDDTELWHKNIVVGQEHSCPTMFLMRTLFLDLASHHGLLACVTTSSVLASRTIDHRIGDHELVPLIKGLLNDADWGYPDLTQVACVVGPGGFTSLRVAVAYANALVWGLKIPVAGVHLSDLYQARVGAQHRGAVPLLWLHSTKKHSTTPSGLRGAGELFVRGFGTFEKEFPEAACVTVEDLVGARHGVPLHNAHYVGEIIPEHESILTKHGFQQVETTPLIDVLPSFLSQQNFSVGAYGHTPLQPWYGRGW